MDPKVEYKREGMKMFDQMWDSIGERTTDLIFRMEQLDEDFVGSTWVETSARHDEAASASEMASSRSRRSTPAKAISGSTRFAIAANAWDATIPAPAAAARSTRTAACESRL